MVFRRRRQQSLRCWTRQEGQKDVGAFQPRIFETEQLGFWKRGRDVYSEVAPRREERDALENKAQKSLFMKARHGWRGTSVAPRVETI